MSSNNLDEHTSQRLVVRVNHPEDDPRSEGQELLRPDDADLSDALLDHAAVAALTTDDQFSRFSAQM